MNKKGIVFAIFATTFAFLFGSPQIFVQATTLEAPFEQCLGAENETYQCMDSTHPNGPTYQFQNIADNHPALFFNDADDGIITLTMPFTFTFFDLASNKLSVSMNGTIKFGSPLSSTIPRAPLPPNKTTGAIPQLLGPSAQPG